MCRICWSVRHLSTHLQTNYLKYNLVNSSNWRPQESPTPPLWVGQMFNSLLLLFKNRTILGLFFVSFRSFTSKQHKFSNKIMYKISIQYLVPGFELTTFCFEPPPLTTRTGHPSFTHWSLVPPFGMVWINVFVNLKFYFRLKWLTAHNNILCANVCDLVKRAKSWILLLLRYIEDDFSTNFK